jgi:hypothetical protein
VRNPFANVGSYLSGVFLQVVHTESILYCQAYSQEERDSWVLALRAVAPNVVRANESRLQSPCEEQQSTERPLCITPPPSSLSSATNTIQEALPYIAANPVDSALPLVNDVTQSELPGAPASSVSPDNTNANPSRDLFLEDSPYERIPAELYDTDDGEYEHVDLSEDELAPVASQSKSAIMEELSATDANLEGLYARVVKRNTPSTRRPPMPLPGSASDQSIEASFTSVCE